MTGLASFSLVKHNPNQDHFLTADFGGHDLLPPPRLEALHAGTSGAGGFIAALKAEIETAGIIDDTTAVAFEF